MIWYVCFFLALILIGSAVALAFSRKYGDLRIGVILLILFAAAFIAYCPLFLSLYDASVTVFAPLLHAMRIVTLDAFHLDYYEDIIRLLSDGFFAHCYFFLLGLLHLVIPIISVLTAYTLLLRCYAGLQTFVINCRRRPLYILSGWSDETYLLAKSIRAAEKHSDIIISDCAERPKNQDLLALHCVFHGDSITKLRVRRNDKKQIYYFCINPDEDKNLNDTLSLIRTCGKYSHLAQSNTHILLRSKLSDCDTMIDSTQKGSIDIRILNDSEEAAYQLLQEHPLLKGAKDGNINLLLVGFGEINQNVLRTAVWCGQLCDYTLQIHVCGLQIDEACKHFLVRYPALSSEGRYAITYDSCDDYAALEQRLSALGSDATYIVLDCGDDRQNLEQALLLRQQLYLTDEAFSHAPPIYLVTHAAEKCDMIASLRTSDTKDGRRVPYGFIPFGAPESIYSYSALVRAPLEGLARNVHLEYSDIFSNGSFEVEDALKQYNLSEVKKRSNRANALHIRYKLAYLGLDYTEDPNAQDVDFASYITEEKMRKLSFSEHSRWLAFLESEGWREATIPQVKAYQAAGLAPGRHESAILKMHPFICDYEELPERSEALNQKDSTIYDEMLIARIPEILHDRWGVTGRIYHIIPSEQSLGGKQ